MKKIMAYLKRIKVRIKANLVLDDRLRFQVNQE